ncbi:MAG: hypothetical protein HY531_01535 [Chloroflexi bacterium]|nr:hypothetical protein [Chloroflexota bacterium]
MVKVKVEPSRTYSTHDRKVREVARGLEKQGYTVLADIRGREKPNPVGSKKLKPDIVAIGHGRRIIVEVETPASLVVGKERLKTFARHVEQKADTTLRVVVTKPRKT